MTPATRAALSALDVQREATYHSAICLRATARLLKAKQAAIMAPAKSREEERQLARVRLFNHSLVAHEQAFRNAVEGL